MDIKILFANDKLEKCVEGREIPYNDKIYLIQYHFLKHKETNQEFTTTELDELNLENLYCAANEPEKVTWRECKREKRATMSDLFKSGDDFKFSDFDYSSRNGKRILKEIKKKEQETRDSASYRPRGWRDWKFGL